MTRPCSSNVDFVDAAAVADVIGIEIEHVNFAAEGPRVRRVPRRAGRTPNPDVLCNAEIKFKAFLDHALGMGADCIATGHYARVREEAGQFELLKADDASKDQSYFLYRLNQAQLSRTLFPLGSMLKRDVRALARGIGLPNHAKRDSTGICFVGERPFREFLMRYIAVVQHGALPRRDGPLRAGKGQVKALRRGARQRARRVLLAVARLGRVGPGAGAWPAVQLASWASRRCDSSQGWSWPCTTRSTLVSSSLRATNHGACSPPPRCAPLSFTPPMPRPWRWPSV